MKRAAARVALTFLLLYAGYFCLWLGLISACLARSNGTCGDDAMTASVRVLYTPVLRAFVGDF